MVWFLSRHTVAYRIVSNLETTEGWIAYEFNCLSQA